MKPIAAIAKSDAPTTKYRAHVRTRSAMYENLERRFPRLIDLIRLRRPRGEAATEPSRPSDLTGHEQTNPRIHAEDEHRPRTELGLKKTRQRDRLPFRPD